MNKPAPTQTAKPTTTSEILNRCKESEENIRKLAQWVVANPWIDQAKLDLTIPGMAIIHFEPHCKALVLEKLGASGWRLDSGDEFEKTVDGIRFGIRRERVHLFGEIPESEMLKGGN